MGFRGTSRSGGKSGGDIALVIEGRFCVEAAVERSKELRVNLKEIWESFCSHIDTGNGRAEDGKLEFLHSESDCSYYSFRLPKGVRAQFIVDKERTTAILYCVDNHDDSYGVANKTLENKSHLNLIEKALQGKLFEVKATNENSLDSLQNITSVPIRLFQFNPSQTIDDLLERFRELRYELSATQKQIILKSYEKGSSILIEGPAGTGKSLLLFRALFKDVGQIKNYQELSEAIYVSCNDKLSEYWKSYYKKTSQESRMKAKFTTIQDLIPGLKGSFDYLGSLIEGMNFKRRHIEVLNEYLPDTKSREFIPALSRLLYVINSLRVGIERSEIIRYLKQVICTNNHQVDEFADVILEIMDKLDEKANVERAHKKNELLLPWEVMKNALESPMDLSNSLLLIDEAQDFTESELYYLKLSNPAMCLIACDYNQQVLGHFTRREFITRAFYPPEVKEYKLTEVYRNTRDIFLLARIFRNKAITKDGDLLTEPIIPYQKPIVSRVSGIDELVDKLKTTFKEDNEINMAVLLPNRAVKEQFEACFRDCDSRGIFPYVISEIKGLEFSNVILYNPHEIDQKRNKDLNEKLYTSVTRAKYMLLTIFSNENAGEDEVFPLFVSEIDQENHEKASTEMNLAKAVKEMKIHGKKYLEYSEILRMVMKRAESLFERFKESKDEVSLGQAIELLTKHEMNVELIKKLIEVNEVFYAAMIASISDVDDDLIKLISEKDSFIGLVLQNI